MSAFDPNEFLSTSVEGANDTEYATLSPGEYVAVIDKIDLNKREGKDGEFFYPLDIFWQLTSPTQEQIDAMGRDKIVIKQSIFLDFNASGALDLGKGKNVGLGKLREALGQNQPGWKPANLIGAGPALVKVTQAPDKNGVVRNNVTAVGKVS